MIIMIWCQDIDGGIGYQNKLPWHDKEELQHFKNTTLNKICVMGRKTYESIGQPLPNRQNIVLTKNKIWKANDIIVYHDLEQIIELSKINDVFIIGGKTLYEYFLPLADKLIISVMKKKYDCDLYLKINLKEFRLTKQENRAHFNIFYYTNKKRS